MDACIILLYVFVGILVTFLVLGIYDEYKDHCARRSFFDSCKPGQVFHCKEPTDNPFDKPVEYDIHIIDKKKNAVGKMYVKFMVRLGVSEYEQSCPFENFCDRYLNYIDYDSK